MDPHLKQSSWFFFGFLASVLLTEAAAPKNIQEHL
jgi:hypothetical protein